MIVPKHTPNKDRITLAEIFNIALPVDPWLNKVNVSREKEENVVNPPKKPRISNGCHQEVSIRRFINMICKKLIRNEPLTFTNNVPKGKVLLKNIIAERLTKYLDVEPNAPPKATKSTVFMDN